MTEEEYNCLQAKRVEKAEGAPFVVQLEKVGTCENTWWEAVDEEGKHVMNMPIPSTITALLEQVNRLIRQASKR